VVAVSLDTESRTFVGCQKDPPWTKKWSGPEGPLLENAFSGQI
jgi:hypothetical protein